MRPCAACRPNTTTHCLCRLVHFTQDAPNTFTSKLRGWPVLHLLGVASSVPLNIYYNGSRAVCSSQVGADIDRDLTISTSLGCFYCKLMCGTLAFSGSSHHPVLSCFLAQLVYKSTSRSLTACMHRLTRVAATRGGGTRERSAYALQRRPRLSAYRSKGSAMTKDSPICPERERACFSIMISRSSWINIKCHAFKLFTVPAPSSRAATTDRPSR